MPSLPQRAGAGDGPAADPRVIAGFYGVSAAGGLALWGGGAFAGAELTTLGNEEDPGIVVGDSMVAVEQLMAHWTAQGLPLASGASEAEIRSFESRCGFELPGDLRIYFRRVNGLVQRGGFDVDEDGFAFWPLEDVQPLLTVCTKYQQPVPPVPDPQAYFVFADYLQWSWAYAIRLGTSGNPVIFVGAEGPVVANSFTEFVALYVQDADPLYPAPHPPG
jgi:hypothetical protein